MSAKNKLPEATPLILDILRKKEWAENSGDFLSSLDQCTTAYENYCSGMKQRPFAFASMARTFNDAYDALKLEFTIAFKRHKGEIVTEAEVQACRAEYAETKDNPQCWDLIPSQAEDSAQFNNMDIVTVYVRDVLPAGEDPISVFVSDDYSHKLKSVPDDYQLLVDQMIAQAALLSISQQWMQVHEKARDLQRPTNGRRRT